MAPTKGNTGSKKHTVLEATVTTSKSTALSASLSAETMAAVPPKKRGPARLPGHFHNKSTMAPTKGNTGSKKPTVLKATITTSKSTVLSASSSGHTMAVVPPKKRGPARLPGQKDDVNQRMIHYRRRQREQENKVSVVLHLCGDPVGQLKKAGLRGFIIQRMDILLNFIANVSFGDNDQKKKLRDIIHMNVCLVDQAHSGYVGVVSMELMMGLLLDLRSDETTIANLGWQSIRKLPEEGYGRADYLMFHWQQNPSEIGSLRDGFVADWKVKVKTLRKPTLAMIEVLARNILKGIGMCSKDDSDLDVDKKWAYFPGLVRTNVPYNQVAHQDMGERTGFIVHMPLTKEGMVLMILPTHRVVYTKKGVGVPAQTQKPGNSQAIYLFIPYGSYLVLPSAVNHAGVYGNTGNLRFHMGIRLRDDGDWGTDTLAKNELAIKHNSNHNKFNNVTWKKVMTSGQDSYSDFSEIYTSSMKERFGMLFADMWLDLLSPAQMNVTNRKVKK